MEKCKACCMISVPNYGLGREGAADYDEYEEYQDFNELNEQTIANKVLYRNINKVQKY